METVEQVVYQEALRGIDLQRQTVDALRSRAGTLLAAAALVTTFLGGEAFEGNREVGAWGAVGIGAFVAVALATMIILLPWRFHFILEPPKLVEDYIDEHPTPSGRVVLRDLALHHDENRQNNDPKIGRLLTLFQGAAVLLGVEVIAWLLEL